ncbi:MAG TPA: DUF1828 domain-containing protein [Candidatus Brocadiia bacterium]|nr:DUF1828 domain-containing protein [Planctomycetota bacterium]MDO8093558.1 DUF1828 domain-containing protein [Candidatus Brocadiales bacterium]
MILKECHDLIIAYTNWLREKITVQDINGVCEITTPFLDRHNDCLQIYVKLSDGGLVLTDDGYTIKDLQLSGCEFTSEKRKQLLHSILNGFGVRIQGEELIVEAQVHNFPQKKHNLLQAMLAVNDLFTLAEPMVARLFMADVERFLRLHKVRFTPSVKFTGRSGYDHCFDFVIPASRTKPERILRAINHPDRQSAINLAFAWDETKEARDPDSTAYGILNDTRKVVAPDVIGALKQYGVKTIVWSRRDEYVEELAA